MNKFTCVAAICLFFSQHVSAQWKWAVGSNCPKGAVESYPIAIDASGNVYEAGIPDGAFYFGRDSTLYGTVLVSADSNGASRWILGFNGSTINTLTTDKENNVYLFGFAIGSFTLGAYTLTGPSHFGYCAKISASGSVKWLSKVCDSSLIYTGGTDTSGNVYCVGSYNGLSTVVGTSRMLNTASPGNSDALIAKLDSNGAGVWGACFGGDSGAVFNVISVNADGESYVVGSYNAPGFTMGGTALTSPSGLSWKYGLVAKIDNNGAAEWVNQVTARGPDYLNGISLGADDNVYVTGYYLGNLVFGHDSLTDNPGIDGLMFLTSYGRNGNLRWALNKNNPYSAAWSVAADICGNIWVSGSGGVPLAGAVDETYILKFDSSGITTDSLFLPTGGEDANAITVDNKGNLYLGGDYESGLGYTADNFMIGHDTLRLKDSTLETLFIARYEYPICMPLKQGIVQASVLSSEPFVFPNPVMDQVTIENAKNNQVTIFNLIGQKLYQRVIPDNIETIDIASYPKGVYVIELLDPVIMSRVTAKLVKE